MRITFSVCLTIFAAGCSGGEKPSELPSSTSSSATAATNSTNATPTSTMAAPTATPNATPENPPRDGCGGKTCATGESCVSYYGIAGARGPQFHDCVIPCRRGTPNDGCPSGKRCSTIADGPGDVCQ